jgi:outer membrane lipoprotein-sorting protein
MVPDPSLHIGLSKAKVLLLGLLVFLIFGCKSSKNVSAEGLVKDLPVKTIIANHYKNRLDFKTISGKIRIDYSEGSSTQSVGVSFRMKKDEAIWISAPLGVIKAYITPERVSFYNKLQNEYFDGDYSYFNEILGFDIDFFKIQNLLTGEALLDLKAIKYNAGTNGKYYELTPKKSSEILKTLFFVEPENYKLARQQLSQPQEKRLLDIHYKNYLKHGSRVLPHEVGIVAIESMQRTFIDITYKNIEFDRELNFPYRIPKGYDEILVK